MFTDAFPDRLFELRGLEQSLVEGDASERFVGFKDAAGHADINILAGLEVEAQTTKHEGDQPAGAGANDEVEVVAWLGNFIATGGLAFAFDVDAVHEFLEDDKHGVATHAAAI